MSLTQPLPKSSTQKAGVDPWVSPVMSDRLMGWSEPFQLYGIAAFTFLEVVIELLRTDPRALVSFNEVRSDAFGKTWLKLTGGDPTQGPLRDIVPLLGSAKGVVLELGPGSGSQVKYLINEKIEKVYGAEPCDLLHEPLKAAATKAGLASKYHVLDCGGQRASLVPQLERAGLLRNGPEPIFDTIICSKVLCSIPDLEDTVACLYDLLKPGGRMLVLEHVKNPWTTRKGSLIARLIQIFVTFIGWSFFLGGCHLNKKSDQVLKNVAKKDGGWEKSDLDEIVTWHPIPFVMGELVKKS